MTPDEVLNVDIVEALGLGQASEEEKESALDDAATFILMRVINRIRLELPLGKRDELERILKPEASNEERVAFLTEHVPDFEDMLLEEILKFKMAMAGETQSEK